jgi:hypothetical protein
MVPARSLPSVGDRLEGLERGTKDNRYLDTSRTLLGLLRSRSMLAWRFEDEDEEAAGADE